VINNNQAVNGGGVSVDASSNQDSALRLFSTDAKRPVRISSNAASANGGGIYLKPDSTDDVSTASAALCAHDYRIDSNDAMEGSAIYAGGAGFSEGLVFLRAPNAQAARSSCDPETPESLGAVACTPDGSCNLIDANEAVDINNNNLPTDGATIFGQSNLVSADRLMLRGNNGGYALRQTGGSLGELSNCLFAENQLRHEVIFTDSGSGLNINNCTFANDLIGAAYVIRNDTRLTLTNSIIDEAGTLSVDYSGDPANRNFAYILTNDSALVLLGLGIKHDDPFFVGNGNYHLQAYVQNGVITASHAIDYAPLVPGDDFDLDGRLRDQDVAAVGDVFGYRDLGAYEMQPIADRIFAGTFGDPISLVY
jgi:hypothetical protein